MATLIMNDQIDFSSVWYPTHVVGKNKEIISVYIGAPQTVLMGYIGIYVRNEDYDKINHAKAYIFIHNPDANHDDVVHINWDEIPDIMEHKVSDRKHFHIFREPKFKE